MSKTVELSVVIPLYDEEESIPHLLRELIPVCDSIGRDYEIVMVDDGSTDGTAELLNQAAQSNDRIKVIRLSRNFGQQSAYNAGFDFASGSMVVAMDGDLQYPPSMIPVFIGHADQGHDIVIGERLRNDQNNWLRERIGQVTYKFLSMITNLEFRNACDFGLYKRSVINTLKTMPEKERFLRGMVQWSGFKKKYVPYSAKNREFGVPKYDFKKLVKLVISGITSFSAFPLRLALFFGIFILLLSIGFSSYVIYDHYVHPNPLIPGWATVVILILFMGSFQSLILGVVGEYLYRMFNEVKGRPNYIVAEVKNIDHDNLQLSNYGIYHNSRSAKAK